MSGCRCRIATTSGTDGILDRRRLWPGQLVQLVESFRRLCLVVTASPFSPGYQPARCRTRPPRSPRPGARPGTAGAAAPERSCDLVRPVPVRDERHRAEHRRPVRVEPGADLVDEIRSCRHPGPQGPVVADLLPAAGRGGRLPAASPFGRVWQSAKPWFGEEGGVGRVEYWNDPAAPKPNSL